MELLPNGMCIKPTFILEADKDGNKSIVFTEMRPEPLWEYAAGEWVTD